ncbi:MAG: hypothetical protein MUQ10_15980, partial [Anaerolineae bacterium]|nr:hypothetical protein [Anaerolineae bacterium]
RSVLYVADVPRSRRVYEQRPEWCVPKPKKPMGKRVLKPHVLWSEPSVPASEIAARPDTA